MTDGAQKKYVLGDVEVVLTGRTAIREIGTVGKRVGSRTDTLYEIKPADREDGSWKKWIRLPDLYEITDENNE